MGSDFESVKTPGPILHGVECLIVGIRAIIMLFTQKYNNVQIQGKKHTAFEKPSLIYPPSERPL